MLSGVLGAALGRRIGAAASTLGAVAVSVIACAACGGAATKDHATVDWPGWGNGAGNTHFAALTQVDAANVRTLRLAWSAPEGPYQFEWETFPIVVGRTMYYDTDTGQVVAANAATGHVIWEYTPEVDFLAAPGGPGRRRSTVG